MNLHNVGNLFCACFAALTLAFASQISIAGPLRDRIMAHRASQENTISADDNEFVTAESLSANVRVIRDVSYGADERQRFDVYMPNEAKNAPVIFMVHGGGWSRGDKSMRSVVENKVARWASQGFIFISTNYRMLPDTTPIDQAQDIAQALVTAQEKVLSWGGDRSKFILMGHSAGAHLIGMLSASPSMAVDIGATLWLGAVLLDSAALNVVDIMQTRHPRLYDQAFGRDSTYWRAASPFYVLTKAGPPVLLVCSTRREDSCSQAVHFADKASALSMRTVVLKENLSHRDINQLLGENNAYTRSVESFLRTLDEKMGKTLRPL